MTDTAGRPLASTKMARFLDRRIQELQDRKNPKSQRQIAAEAGFNRPNIISMLKNGESKVPLDRVPALARALETDMRHLFRLALEQHFRGAEISAAIAEVFGNVVSNNEMQWVELIRDISNNSDPMPTETMKAEVRDVLSRHFERTTV